MVMIGMMLIVAARWVQLSKEEFAPACEFWSPVFSRKFCLGWDPGLFLVMFRYGDFWCWPKAERWKTVNVPDVTARSRWAFLEKRQRADCPLTNVTDGSSIFNNGQHLFTQV